MSSPVSSSIEGRAACELSPRHLQRPLISLLVESQNPDGGWGYRTGASSAVEPSAWALLALSTAAELSELPQAVYSGLRWLSNSQLADGSWPSFPGQDQGCWTTSLCCGACSVYSPRLPEYCEGPLSRGLEWLCRDVPGDGSWRSRLWSKVKPSSGPSTPGVYGWSWTKNTSSWVEPTAYSLLALRAAPAALLPKRAKGRVERAEQFLFEERCHHAGWDAGNPHRAGIDRTPQAEPTAWALIALSHHAGCIAIQEGLEWLESRTPHLKGLATRAVVQLCLHAYGRIAGLVPEDPWASERPRLPDVLATSWMALAVDGLWQRSTTFLKRN